MKKLLLLLSALVMANVTLVAATWNKPVPKDYTVKDGDVFYLYNAAQNLFLSHDGITVVLGQQGTALTATKLASGDFRLHTSDDGYLYANVDFVCSDGSATDANIDWYLEKQADASYLIRPSKSDPDHSWADYPDHWMGIVSGANFLVPLLKPESADIKWYAIGEEDMLHFSSLYMLDAVMTELQGYGYDVSELLSLYNNVDAKKEDLDGAINSVQAVLANYRIENATESSPVDVTSLYVRNAGLDEEWVSDGHDVPGWTMLPSTFCGMGESDYVETFYTDTKTLGSWSGAAFGDNKVYQTLTNLRNGKYRLGNYGIWIRHTGNEGAPIEGAYIYAKVGDKLYCEPLVDTGWWRGLSEVVFECRSGEAEVGIMFEATNVGQCIIYDFRLEYMGEATPASRVKELIDKSNAVVAAAQVNKKYISTLNDDIERGNALIAEKNDVELETLYYKFLADFEDAQKNAEAYLTLEKLITKAEATISQGESESIGVLSDYVLENELSDKATQYAFDNEQIEKINAELSLLIEEASNSVIKPGQDITYLVANADFSKSNGWENKVNENGTGFDTSNKLLNKWWSDWEAEQTLVNLPNGTYRLEVQGFQWHSWDWAQAQSQWEAGDGTDPTYDVTTLIGLNDVFVPACNVFSCGPTDIKEGYDTGAYFVPNNEATAVKFFALGLYQNVVEAEVCDHTLKITFDCSVNGFWNCFTNLRLTYVSTDFTDAISDVNTAAQKSGVAYSLQGTVVNPSSYKGIYIKDGKKHRNK